MSPLAGRAPNPLGSAPGPVIPPLRVGDLSPTQLRHRLVDGLVFETGPFRLRLSSRVPGFSAVFRALYGVARVVSEPLDDVADFHVALRRPVGMHRWWRPQAQFSVDGQFPFAPFPLDHAFPLFEWGLNWCIATRAHRYLMLHSAALERGGKGLLLPAVPGSGKSTLCAALVARGWRLLSDEFGLLRPEDGCLAPLPRPIPLKNASIAVYRTFAPEMAMGPIYTKTRKGTVSHVCPPRASVLRSGESVRPQWVVFPRYRAGAKADLHRFPRGRSFIQLSGNAFNYEMKGRDGFRAVSAMARECSLHLLEFDDLGAAVEAVDRLCRD